MLILEGADLVGKTTLAKVLTKALASEGYVYSWFNRLPSGFKFPQGYFERASRRIVQDRFHMSEIAYARMRSEETQLTPEMYRIVDGHLRGMGAFTVVLTCTDSLLEKRYRPDEMYPLACVKEVNETFMQLARGEWSGYHVDVDLSFHCNEEHPYVENAGIELILRLYKARQFAVEQIIRSLFVEQVYT